VPSPTEVSVFVKACLTQKKKLETKDLLAREIRKFTVFTLSLRLLSTPNPSFSGIRKVKKFY
jgi:hypothetical protein